MAHPWIEASLKYRKAQAIVLREAERWIISKDDKALSDAVKVMQEARVEYVTNKTKALAE